MKPSIILIALFCCLNICEAQQYRCFTPNSKQYFTNAHSYLRGMRIDSVRISGTDTIYYPFHTLRGKCYIPNISGHPASGILDSNGGSWLGKKVMQKANGDFLFDNIWNDTLVIKTQAKLGDSWTLYSDTSTRFYQATVSSLDTMTILGVADSVKTISITAYNGSSIDATNPINKFKIILSKNHGFTQVFDLYTFPYHNPDTTCSSYDLYFSMATSNPFGIPYATGKPDTFQLFSQVNFHNPRLTEIYDNYDSGDIIYLTTSYVNMGGTYFDDYRTDSFTSKTTVAGINTYTVHYSHSYHVSNATTHYSTADSGIVYNFSYSDTSLLIDTSKMPEEWRVGKFYYYSPSDTSCFSSPSYSINQDYIYTTAGTININTFEFCGTNEFYKVGVGRTYYHTCDGTPDGHVSTTEIIRKGNCKPLSVPALSNANTEIKVYPNPANDQLNLNLPVGKNYTIHLVNMMGQEIANTVTTRPNVTLSTNTIPVGIYILKIIDETGSIATKKIVIEH